MTLNILSIAPYTATLHRTYIAAYISPASLRGERDIAIGNVVGSCIFNILSVMSIKQSWAAHKHACSA